MRPIRQMPDFTKLIARLQKHYGAPELPPARGAFELVIWENACYLLPDHRRAAVFDALRAQVGLTADAIFKAPREVLLPLAAMGGMRPETRVFRWQEIARIPQINSKAISSRSWSGPTPRQKRRSNSFPVSATRGRRRFSSSAALRLDYRWNQTACAC
jgi:endonuclease-3